MRPAICSIDCSRFPRDPREISRLGAPWRQRRGAAGGAIPGAAAFSAMMGEPEKTILVVEDDDDVRDVAAGVLEAAGYRIFEASNADAAYRLLRDHPDLRIDLLFTDVVMPGRLDGVSLADAAVALRPSLKVLYTTGFADLVRDHRDAKLWGQVLNKPYRPVELCRIVGDVLLGRKARRR
jgi:CheY-like chemotaxis protein